MRIYQLLSNNCFEVTEMSKSHEIDFFSISDNMKVFYIFSEHILKHFFLPFAKDFEFHFLRIILDYVWLTFFFIQPDFN